MLIFVYDILLYPDQEDGAFKFNNKIPCQVDKAFNYVSQFVSSFRQVDPRP